MNRKNENIEKVHLEHLANAELSAFINELLTLIERFNPQILNVEVIYEKIQKIYGYIGEIVGYERMSSITNELRQTDKSRNTCYLSFKHSVVAFLNYPDEAKSRAADRIFLVIRQFGYIYRKSATNKSASITGLLGAVRDNFQQDIETLNVAAQIEILEQENEKYITLTALRDNETAKKQPTYRASRVRKMFYDVYVEFCDWIFANSVVNVNGDFGEFISRWNVVVRSYRQTLAQRKGFAKRRRKLADEKAKEGIVE